LNRSLLNDIKGSNAALTPEVDNRYKLKWLGIKNDYQTLVDLLSVNVVEKYDDCHRVIGGE